MNDYVYTLTPTKTRGFRIRVYEENPNIPREQPPEPLAQDYTGDSTLVGIKIKKTNSQLSENNNNRIRE